MSNIYLYPLLNSNQVNELIKIDLSFYYMNRTNEVIRLEHEYIGKRSIKVLDHNDDWNYKDNGLNVSIKSTILSSNKFFIDPKVACSDSLIGYGLEWYSQESRQRGFIQIGVISKDSNNITVDKSLFIQHKKFKSSVDFDIVFYIDSPGSADEKQKHYANEPGIILGSSRIMTLILEGSGSIFPIMSIYDHSKPLWEVRVDVESIYDDPFTKDYVCIYLNKAHKDYTFIDKHSNDFNISFLKDVLSSAITQIMVELVKDIDNNTIEGGNEEGTIISILYYFQQKHKWNFTSLNSISNSIKTYFDKEFKL